MNTTPTALAVALAMALPLGGRAQNIVQGATGTQRVSAAAQASAATAALASNATTVAPPAFSTNREHFVAIDNVCAWPNLIALRSGELVVPVFNEPCHGLWEGDIECWGSANGRFWAKRGLVTRHEPGTARMNAASGRAGNGDLIALVNGWYRPSAPSPRPMFPLDSSKAWVDAVVASKALALDVWACRSSDGGHTWTQTKNAVEMPPGTTTPLRLSPFGPIVADDNGRLYAAFYTNVNELKSFLKPTGVWFYRSDDDGRIWRPVAKIGTVNGNETSLLHLGGGRWLAAQRTYKERALEMFHSRDNGLTWTSQGQLTSKNQHPAHMLRLADKRILLTYADRAKAEKEILTRFSADEGETWGPPQVLATFTDDGGYPSSAQLADGMIVTAFYAASIPSHQRYHMGVVRWRPTHQ